MMRGAYIVVKMSKSGHATVPLQAVISSSVISSDGQNMPTFIDAQREKHLQRPQLPQSTSENEIKHTENFKCLFALYSHVFRHPSAVN
jgi:hypothetical protein